MIEYRGVTHAVEDAVSDVLHVGRACCSVHKDISPVHLFPVWALPCDHLCSHQRQPGGALQRLEVCLSGLVSPLRV